MKPLSVLLLSGMMLTSQIQAQPLSEPASLSLLLTQLDMLDATLQRAENQASASPVSRFFFDYPQAHADIRTIRQGIKHYLAPSRAQPRTVLPLTPTYRREHTQ